MHLYLCIQGWGWKTIFPECVARVPVSLWGSGGWGSVRSTLGLQLRPFAAVRNRPREGRMAVPMASFAKGVSFGGFKCRVASCRVAGMALGEVPACFITCQKSLCVAGAILLRRFQKMRSSFQVDRSLARNIDFQVANCGVHKKTRRKTSILKLHSVKIGGSLARNARFDAPTCLVSSLWFSSGLAVSMGEVAKPILFHGVNLSCNVALRVRHFGDILMCLQMCRKTFCGMRNTFASFSEDEEALHSTLYTPHFRLDILHSALYTVHFTLYTSHSTLYTLHFTLHTVHSTLYTLHSALYTLHFTLHTLHILHSTPHTLHFTLHTVHSTLYTPHSTLSPHSTLYFTLHTLHFTLYTLHSTLYTPRPTLHTPDSTLHNLHFTLHTPHFTFYTLHLQFTLFTLHTLHSTLYTPHFTLQTLHSTLHTSHSTLHTLDFTLHTPHFTLYTVHSTLYSPHFTLHTLHSTLCTPHSTLYTLHFTHHTLHSTPFHIPQSTAHWYGNRGKCRRLFKKCFAKVFYVTAFAFGPHLVFNLGIRSEFQPCSCTIYIYTYIYIYACVCVLVCIYIYTLYM